MTQYLKAKDGVRSLIRGIESDLKSLELSSEKTFPRLRSKLKKSLEELSSEITNLYPYLEEETLSTLELENRKATVSEFESSHRSFESKLVYLESNPPQTIPEEHFGSPDSVESILKSRKMHSFETDYKTPALIQEIDTEMSESFSIPSLKVYISGLSDIQLFILIGVILILLIWLIFD